MQIVRTGEKLAFELSRLRGRGRVALVPTMGALHAGHLALVDEAKRRAETVVASIFVNPRQFGAGEDLDRYPRSEEQDCGLLAERGCDLLWMPSVGDIYPPGFATTVSVSGVADRWEGDARPGHFDGVATIVCKLLLTVTPDVALFGEKDFQQLAVIRRLGRDLNLPVDIAGVATVREADGLALSSRNAYLSASDRVQAAQLYRSLQFVRDAVRRGDPVAAALGEAKRMLGAAGFSRLDYLALVDAETLEPLEAPAGNMRVLAAAVIGTTRLIDNIAV